MTERKRAVRDPIHGYIHLSKEENDLIDSPFVQRLRWISQLSGVRLVFPGGTHSRLAHIMGVMHLSGLYAEQIYHGHPKFEHKVQLARLAGLLHDIAHGAFSHAYDDTVYRALYPGNPHGHDTHRMIMIKSDHLRPLIEACGVTPEEIEDLWNGKDRVLQAAVQGALGADRMDFMLRDSYYAGTTHFGTVASTRIISNTLVADHDNSQALHYNYKVLDDIFQALLGRFYMYRGVYFHKASGASDILIRKMLEHASEPLMLPERTRDLELYKDINEYTVIGEIMASKDPELKLAKRYCERLMRRELPKLVWESIVPENVVKTISSDLERGSELIANEKFINEIKKTATELGKKEPVLYVTNTYPMSTLDHAEFTAGHIYIYDKHGSLVPGKTSITLAEAIESTSYFKTFISGLGNRQRYVMIRVYCDPEDAVWIREKVGRKFAISEPDIAETSY